MTEYPQKKRQTLSSSLSNPHAVSTNTSQAGINAFLPVDFLFCLLFVVIGFLLFLIV